MRAVLEFLVVFTVCVLPQIVVALFILRDPEYTRRRSSRQRTVTGWMTHATSILLLIYIAGNQPTGLASIGLSLPPSERLLTLFVGGLTTIFLVVLAFSQQLHSQKERERREALRRTIFEAGGFSHVQGFWSRGAFLSSVWLGVIAEDLVFRGYLVLGLWAQSGRLWPWVALSALLSVAVHLYQGLNWRVMLSQALFALIFIGVTVLAGNVLVAILPHLVYDTLWMIRGWAKDSSVDLSQPEAAR